MTSVHSDSTGPSLLEVLHCRLEKHFTSLSETRAVLHPGAPVFALEHGFADAELRLLRSEVSASVRRGQLSGRYWLPLVVYAAEIGYFYTGDEYWHTFENNTPGWAELEERPFIRDLFKDFRRRFNGAEPSGPWAGQFTIICWPITHAVLPVDLQRQLAKLLFDYRRSITSAQLATPDELGARLAARALHASARFRAFAENPSLLGTVAAALLLGEGDHKSRLLDSTLSRIIENLTSERQERRWLGDAQAAAARVNSRGFRPPAPGHGRQTVQTGGPLAPAADPLVFLQRQDDGWAAFLEMPDFTVLAERLAELVGELERRRAIVQGAAGPPLARGRLLHPGQRIRLASWPSSSRPLIQLEGGASSANSLLADQSVMTRGPTWLFRIGAPGMAREVRGKFVRAGHQYVVITTRDAPDGLPGWIRRDRSSVAGVTALALDVPDSINADHLRSLEQIGAGIISEVELRPAGVVPAHWDGEGRGEWLSGEDPMLALSSRRAVEHCIITQEGTPSLVEWPEAASQIFVKFAELEIGRHEVEIALLLTGEGARQAEVRIEIVIRAPHQRPPAGTKREGLMILTTPVKPTLAELWDETAALEIVGPTGVSVGLNIRLLGSGGDKLAERRLKTSLPLTTGNWQELFDTQIRSGLDFVSAYDKADVMAVHAFHAALGFASLEAERPFEPLMWSVKRDGSEAVLTLLNNTGAQDVVITERTFEQPDRPTRVASSAGVFRSSDGGLVTAVAGAHTAGVIVPRMTIRTLADMALRTEIGVRTKTAESLLELLHVIREWSSAAPPAEAIAATWRQQVLDKLKSALILLVAGERWAQLDASGNRTWKAYYDAVGKIGNKPLLGIRMLRLANELDPSDADGAARSLSAALRSFGPEPPPGGYDKPFATFLLSLASEPASLLTDESSYDLKARLQFVLEHPAVFKAARLLILVLATKPNPSPSAAT